MAKIKCENCGAKYNGNFCPICSTPAPEQPQKKKKWVLPVVIVVVLILLVSCIAGGGDDVKQPSNTTNGSNSSQAASSKDSATKAEKAPAAQAVSISEQELYNKNGIVVTAKKMQDGMFGPEISVTVENNSTQNIVVSSRSLSVNNFMLSTSGLYSDVAAGKKDNAEISQHFTLQQQKLSNSCPMSSVKKQGKKHRNRLKIRDSESSLHLAVSRNPFSFCFNDSPIVWVFV